MNWAHFPYLRIAFIFCVGIIFTSHFDIDSKSLLVVLTCFIVIWAISERAIKKITLKATVNSLLLLICIFCLGSLSLALKNEKLKNQVVSNKAVKQNIISGTITEKLSSKSNYKFVFRIHQFSNAEKSGPANQDVILTFSPKDTLASTYEPGRKIVCKTKLKVFEATSNPEAFDYKEYLRNKGIQEFGYVLDGNHQIAKNGTENWLKRTVAQTTHFTSSTLKKYLKDTTAIAVAEALLLGQQELISKDIYKAYSDTGAIHVLSVSGLHVAIFISPFVWLFSLSKRKNKIWTLIQVLSLLSIVWFYVILTGMSPSVVRAGAMVSIYIIGTKIFKGANAFNMLSIAAILMLVYNPSYLFQVSFQFSYISLISILYFQPKIKLLYHAPNKVTEFVWDLINISFAAQILIFPFTVYYFHQFPLYFMLSGLFAVPLVTIIIYLGTLMICLEPIFSSINQFLSSILEWIIIFLNKVINAISLLPYSIIDNIWITDFLLFLMVLSIILFIVWIEIRYIKVLHLSLSVSILIIASLCNLNIKAEKQQKLFIYDTKGGTIIDIFKGTSLTSVNTDSMSPTMVEYVSKNNRIKHRINVKFNSRKFLHKIGGSLIYIYNKNEDFKLLKKNIDLDMLIVTNTNFNRPIDILSHINPQIIVLDRNLKPWIREKWLNLPYKHNRQVHDILNDGAFKYDFEL